MASEFFTEERMLGVFKTKPVLTGKEIAILLADDTYSMSIQAGSRASYLHKKKILKRHQRGHNVLYSLPSFNGDIDDYLPELKSDAECSSFYWSKEVVKERNHWMKLATQFHQILGNNNMEVFA